MANKSIITITNNNNAISLKEIIFSAHLVQLKNNIRMSTFLEEKLNAIFLLRESRLNDIRQKYPLISPFLDSGFSSPVYQKYIQWIGTQLDKVKTLLMSSEIWSEDYVKALQVLILKFDSLITADRIKTKDINSFKTVRELEDALKKIPDISKTQEKQEAKKNSELIYKDKRYTIIRPLTMEASCYYGKGTRWCISATETKNEFNSYKKDGIKFFFLIDKTPKTSEASKIAVVVEPNDGGINFYDAVDESITKEKFLSFFSEESANPVIDALTKATGYSFEHVTSKVKKLLEILEDVNSEDQILKTLSDLYEREHAQYAGTRGRIYEYADIITELIKQCNINLLPYLYSPTGNNPEQLALFIVGNSVVDAFTNRLKDLRPNITTFLQMANKSFSLVFEFDEGALYNSDPYLTYCESMNNGQENFIVLEDLRKLARFNSRDFVKPPFYDRAVTFFLENYVAPDLGIKKQTNSFNALKNYVLKPSAHNQVIKLAKAIKEKNGIAISDLLDAHYSSIKFQPIEFNSITNLAKLLMAGKLNQKPNEILDPLTS